MHSIRKDHAVTDTPDVSQLLATARAVAENPDASSSEIEAVVVETVSAFAARLQHHFARGPFFAKLRSRLIAEGHGELAQTVYQHYLVANVLKHGAGKSLRELRAMPDLPFTVQEDGASPMITGIGAGLLTGLADALGAAHDILEHR